MQLEKYDIILCKNNRSPVSALIRFFTKDVYSHSELYIGENHIVDALPSGVSIRHIDKSIKEFDAYRYTGKITKEQKRKIEEFIQKEINSKYDFLALVLQAFDLKHDTPQKYICIELVLQAFKEAGLKVGRWQKGFKQITNSKYFAKIN